MSKGHCIICHSDNVDLSDEHVIPEALGGCYHVKNVCKSCNSILGRTVDINLIDHSLIELFRERYQLSGKTGKVPSFLCDHDVHLKEKPEQKMKFLLNKDGELELKYVTKEEPNCSKDGAGPFVLTLDGSEKDKLNEIIEKKTKRCKKKGYKAIFSEPVEYETKGIAVQGDLIIDLLKFKIGILKIAYESLCDLFPEYEKDSYALGISNVLINRKFKEVEHYAKIGNGFEKLPFFDIFKVIQIDITNMHLIYYKFIEKMGLYCFVSLFDTIFLGMKMSDINYLGKYCLYFIANDFCNNIYTKYRFGSKGLEKI